MHDRPYPVESGISPVEDGHHVLALSGLDGDVRVERDGRALLLQVQDQQGQVPHLRNLSNRDLTCVYA